MSKIKLPAINVTPMTVQPSNSTAIFIGAPVAPSTAQQPDINYTLPPENPNIVQNPEEDLKPAVTELPTAQQQQSTVTSDSISAPSSIIGVVQPDTTPVQHTQIGPYTTIDSLARKEAALAQQSAVRAEQIAQAAQARAISATDNFISLQAQTANIAKQVEDLTNKLGAFRSEALTTRDEIWTMVERIRRDVEGFKSSVAAQLAQHGLAVPTSLPRLQLIQNPTRKMFAPPKLIDGSVVFFYNQEKPDGSDATRRLKQGQTERINTGYRIGIPQGYVCDVVVGSDVVQTLHGDLKYDFVLTFLPRLNADVRTGSDLCRLVLRKVEPCELELS